MIRSIRKPLMWLLFIGVAGLTGCHSLDSVEPDNRNTWLYFYGGLGNYEAVSAQPFGDGYIIVADSISASNYGIMVIKTDRLGNELKRINIKRGSANALTVSEGGDAYLIGDRISVDLNAQSVSDQVKRRVRVIRLNADLGVTNDVSYGDNSQGNFSGSAMAIQGSDLTVITNEKLNPIKNVVQLTQTRVYSLNPQDLSVKDSVDQFQYDGRDFINSRSAFVSGDDIIWASCPTIQTVNSTTSFVRLLGLGPNIFRSGSDYGSLTENHIAYDIQQSGPSFGVVGTYATIAGNKANIFFARTSSLNDLQMPENYVKYFDGDLLASTHANVDKNTSNVEDAGTAITGVGDGGFIIAGNTTTTQTGKDILLIRLDPQGTVLWSKTLGGSGDETVSSISKIDGGYLVCGTLDLAGLKSVFLMKVNNDGELKD